MKIFVSACLLGENCKYNGGNNYSEKAANFIKGHEVVALCPEVAGGLPVPRDSAEIVDGIVKTESGRSVDEAFRAGAKKVTAEVIKQKVELALLQSRSPSCGMNEIYDGSFSGKKIKGQGIFAKMLTEQGIKVIDVEDLITEEN
ncbi:MAG: DUF523 domain-containing protein [Clostridiales bacterium]|nr:DUF523 domain-containing protein [Clostridiales bacterium]MDY3745888.1 DUF523 domain-containing protein [Lachnospiraceae bacterium]